MQDTVLIYFFSCMDSFPQFSKLVLNLSDIFKLNSTLKDFMHRKALSKILSKLTKVAKCQHGS